ncbi:MAG: hypothetical protein U9R08_02110 [Nanoarchaeota archaeon]|nr:hypothetical protein [Nanoarchaeota archaeon]
MKKLDKVILLMIFELILAIGLISLSTVSKLLVAIFFPPVIAVTLFALMVSIVDMDTHQRKTAYFVFALFLVGIALFSTSIGFHYASDEINEAFFPYKTDFSLDDILFTKERIYFLDEMFSHYLMIAGAVGMVLGIFSWWYFFKKKALPGFDPDKKDSLVGTFMPVFLGAILGGLSSFGCIEAQLTSYALIIALAVLPPILLKLRTVKMDRAHISFLFLFGITTIGSYLGIILAYLITVKAFPNV